MSDVQLVIEQEHQTVLVAETWQEAQDWLLRNKRTGQIRELPCAMGWLILSPRPTREWYTSG